MNELKQRILTGWTLPRAFYLVAGLFLLVSAIPGSQWFEIAFGAYFTSMGLFAFGCAGGHCAIQSPAPRAEFKTADKPTTENQDS